MYRIGEFSKMSKTTIKALHYYDEIGLLTPEYVDKFTNYRFYTTAQLIKLHKIQSLKQVGLSIDEIRDVLQGSDKDKILLKRKEMLIEELQDCERKLSGIDFLLSGKEELKMNYQAIIKTIPECKVYSKRIVLKDYSEMFTILPGIGQEVMTKYPDLKCAKPEYCICIYHDAEYKDKEIDVEYCEAVTELKENFGDIVFKTMPAITVLSVFHKGSYAGLFDASVYAYKWIDENGYMPVGNVRNSYIDGIWNKETEEEWLTEIQIPVVSKKEVKDKYENTPQYKEWQAKDTKVNMMAKTNDVFKRFAAIRELSPSSQEARDLVSEWKTFLCDNCYTCTNEVLKGLGEMYVSDERFKSNIDAFGEGTAEFVKKAITEYTK